jgi:hypothetical protein
MICDLFLRTFPGDYPWLPFLFRSMAKHVRGFGTIHVVVPEGSEFPIIDIPTVLMSGAAKWVKFGTCPIYPDDYIGQQVTKLRSWEYSDADEICFLDSDLVFKREFTPDTLHWAGSFGQDEYRETEPIIEGRTWESLGTDQSTCWRAPTAMLLGQDPPFETMCRHPFQYSRSMIQRCYNGVGGEAGLLGLGRVFSEFNLLGNWAITKEGAEAVPVDLVARPDIVRQFWSRGGITADVEAEMRALGVWE